MPAPCPSSSSGRLSRDALNWPKCPCGANQTLLSSAFLLFPTRGAFQTAVAFLPSFSDGKSNADTSRCVSKWSQMSPTEETIILIPCVQISERPCCFLRRIWSQIPFLLHLTQLTSIPSRLCPSLTTGLHRTRHRSHRSCRQGGLSYCSQQSAVVLMYECGHCPRLCEHSDIPSCVTGERDRPCLERRFSSFPAAGLKCCSPEHSIYTLSQPRSD